MSKQWVYDQLVKSDQDSAGLIAYALYKKEKKDLADDLRAKGASDEHISHELDTFHSQALSRIDRYRDMGENYITSILESVEATFFQTLERTLERKFEELGHEREKERQRHAQKLQNEKKKFEQRLKREKNALLKRVASYQPPERSVWERIGLFLISGIPSLVSSFILVGCVYATAMYMTPAESRQKILLGFVASVIGEDLSAANKAPTISEVP